MPPRSLWSMVVRIGPLASPSRKPRQARKGAAAPVDASAGVWLVRAASIAFVVEPQGSSCGGAWPDP